MATTSKNKLGELLPGETYALGFRRVCKELAKVLYRARQQRYLTRQQYLVKRLRAVVDAAREYREAREREDTNIKAVQHRERTWARLCLALTECDKGDRISDILKFTMHERIRKYREKAEKKWG